MSIREAFKRYPKAILWAASMSGTIIMTGYDTSLVLNMMVYPSFAEKYGSYYPELDEYVIPGAWQTGLFNAPQCGNIVGLAITGYVTERYGHRRVTAVSLLFLSVFIFVTFFAPSIEVLLVGQLLEGIPWGIFSAIGPAYSSEVCPLPLRGYLTSFVTTCWCLGPLIAAGVLQGLVDNTTEWSYRIPFVIQWAWPVPLLIICVYAPESPWWLVRKGRLQDAEISLGRLSSGISREQIEQKVAMMVHTNNFEKAAQTDSTYRDCFRGTNLRRTEIASVAYAAQALVGTALAYNPTYFFIQAGLNASDAFKINSGDMALAVLGACASWPFMAFFGRRVLLLMGIGLLTPILLVVGLLSYAADEGAATWAQTGLLVLWLGIFSCTLGTQTLVLAAEVSATRLRSQTMAIANAAFNVVNIAALAIEPYLINPTEAGLKGKTALVWLSMSVLFAVWTVFRVPETKGRTYEELDVLFEKRVPAWRFASEQIDAFGRSEATIQQPKVGEQDSAK
ncbi:general substrate transporter [Thozetella sp. PMI_491]|nr:general substrate transporter [Thozetella sp. PMI_491]